MKIIGKETIGYAAKSVTCLLLCVLSGCASLFHMETRDVMSPEMTEDASPSKQESIPASQEDIWVSVTNDALLQQLPHLLAEHMKVIPRYSKLLVSGYEESTSQEGYLKVQSGNDIGYLSIAYVKMDRNLKQYINIEKEKIQKRNAEAIKILEEIQHDIEADKAWVKSVSADIRELPSLSSPVADQLERGSVLYILEEEADWFRVLYDGPFIDYPTLSDSEIAEIVNTYRDYDDLLAAYQEGWIQSHFVSDSETEPLSEDERRRWVYVETHPDLSRIMRNAILNGDIVMGMTKEMVMASWGKADEVNVSRSFIRIYEQWIYSDMYLYFENGILNAWQNFDE